MSEYSKTLSEMSADNALNMTEEHNSVVRLLEEAKAELWCVRLASTNYSVGDKVIIPGVSNFDKVLKCAVAGITESGDFPADYSSLVTGSYIVDGSVTWCVVELVTSVNDKRGDVYLNASDVGAAESDHTHHTSDVTDLQYILDKKAPIDHDHTIIDVSGLQDALDKKADNRHLHQISDIEDLQDKLDDSVNFPNYDAAIDLGSISSYTAPSNGWIFATKMSDSESYWHLRVNGVRVFCTGSTSYGAGSCFVPVKKDDNIQTIFSVNNTTSNPANTEMVFVPSLNEVRK